MKLNLERPLLFFDLETTGLNIGKDRIVEISMLKVMPDGEEICRTLLINPGVPIPRECSELHGIYDMDVKDKPHFEEVADEIMLFIDNADLAGFNSNKFDIPLLVEEFLRCGRKLDFRNRVTIDVQNIFHKMEPRTLGAAYKLYCNKELTDAHQAEADTIASYEVLKAQLLKYENIEYEDRRTGLKSIPIQNNVKKLSDFSRDSRSVDFAGHIIFNDRDEEIFNFGKHKNESVESVFRKEPSYYDWMMKSEFPLYTKEIITMIKNRMF
ncbi:MAG: 3'-5' exonuclease [Bacteroidales bacterium]